MTRLTVLFAVKVPSNLGIVELRYTLSTSFPPNFLVIFLSSLFGTTLFIDADVTATTENFRIL